MALHAPYPQPEPDFAESYSYRRAEAELRMAQAATSPAAVQAHYDLANLYLDRLSKVSDRDVR